MSSLFQYLLFVLSALGSDSNRQASNIPDQETVWSSIDPAVSSI